MLRAFAGVAAVVISGVLLLARRIFKVVAAVVAAGMSTSPSTSTAHLPKQVEYESRNNINKGIDFPYTGPIEPAPQIEIKIIERPAPK